MALSYTAPRFEPEDVQKEFDALDDETKDQLKRDLYGIDTPIDETSDLLEQSLAALREQLSSLEAPEEDDGEHQAYNRAREKCLEYVNSEKFLLPFLRAERFDVDRAVTRILVYWDEKLKLFGEEHSFGPVTLASLQESDIQVIGDGGFSWLPKDAHGRAVLHGDRGRIGIQNYGRDPIVSYRVLILHFSFQSFERARSRYVSHPSLPYSIACSYEHYFTLFTLDLKTMPRVNQREWSWSQLRPAFSKLNTLTESCSNEVTKC